VAACLLPACSRQCACGQQQLLSKLQQPAASSPRRGGLLRFLRLRFPRSSLTRSLLRPRSPAEVPLFKTIPPYLYWHGNPRATISPGSPTTLSRLDRAALGDSLQPMLQPAARNPSLGSRRVWVLIVQLPQLRAVCDTSIMVSQSGLNLHGLLYLYLYTRSILTRVSSIGRHPQVTKWIGVSTAPLRLRP
jgi:hypothetical protein